MTAIASELWSSLASPMQHLAAHVLSDPPEVLAHIGASTRLHARVATAMYERLVAAGVKCRTPRAGFYVYPDFTPLGSQLRDRGITTGSELARELLEQHDIATLPGAAFGAPDEALTLRIATSRLYGADDLRRKAALEADAPDTLPWIADSLDRVGAALAALSE
jgi:aspartate aminotransferase